MAVLHRAIRYTTLAHRYTAKFPMLTYVGIQVNFWIFANILLCIITYLQSRIINQTFNVPSVVSLGTLILFAVILGSIYGVILGITNYQLDQKIFRNQTLGKVIILKTLMSLVVIIAIMVLVRYMLVKGYISQSLSLTRQTWQWLLMLLIVYYFFMTLVISLINQVNKKYGPGVLLPLLFGLYRQPIEEDRIFLFMDLKSSTSTAELLGHIKYSSFIRDCFSDINEVLYRFRAQVYQYVGDEIVVTWPEGEGLKDHNCVRFFFACRDRFKERNEYYITNYGMAPSFKAGGHAGRVTAVEIGEVKRDIAYHGDTLNTAARIQSVCNEYDKGFLLSETLLAKVGIHDAMKTEAIGMIRLKGKMEKVGIVSVDWAGCLNKHL